MRPKRQSHWPEAGAQVADSPYGHCFSCGSTREPCISIDETLAAYPMPCCGAEREELADHQGAGL
jgi:hypothetical protein